MVVGVIFSKAARAGASVIARAVGGHKKDQHLHFITPRQLPELTALSAEPNELHSDAIHATYSHQERKLTVKFQDGAQYIFVFREDDVMVISSEKFCEKRFRERLNQAVLATRAARKALVQDRSPTHG